MQPASTQFHILRSITELSNKLQICGDALYQEMSSKQYYVLCYVDDFYPELPTLGQLADAMGTSHQNTRQLVGKLEKKGYLTLHADADDRRKTRVSLTAKCAGLWEKYQTVQNRYTDSLFEDFSKEELSAMLNNLEKVLSRINL